MIIAYAVIIGIMTLMLSGILGWPIGLGIFAGLCTAVYFDSKSS